MVSQSPSLAAWFMRVVTRLQLSGLLYTKAGCEAQSGFAICFNLSANLHDRYVKSMASGKDEGSLRINHCLHAYIVALRFLYIWPPLKVSIQIWMVMPRAAWFYRLAHQVFRLLHNWPPLKGTQDWDFFWLWFWNLYYFFISYVKKLRFYQKNFFDQAIIGGDTIFPLSLRLSGIEFSLVWD